MQYNISKKLFYKIVYSIQSYNPKKRNPFPFYEIIKLKKLIKSTIFSFCIPKIQFCNIVFPMFQLFIHSLFI